VRERTGHPPSYTEAKKMKSLTLHTHGCLRANLRDCSSSSSSTSKGDFVAQRTNLQFGNRMFEVAGPAEWNSLPEPIRRSSSINRPTFKN